MKLYNHIILVSLLSAIFGSYINAMVTSIEIPPQYALYLMPNPTLFSLVSIAPGGNTNLSSNFFTVGSGAKSMVLSIDRQYLYIASISTITRYDLQNRSSATLSVSPNVMFSQIAMTPDGNYLLALTTTAIIVVDTATFMQVAGSPFTLTGMNNSLNNIIAIHPDYPTNNNAFVTNGDQSNKVMPFTINTGTGAIVLGTIFNVGATPASNDGSGPIAFTPNGETIYIINSGNLYPVNAVSHVVGSPISIGENSNNLLISLNGDKAYLTNNNITPARIRVINLNTQSVTNTITVDAANPFPLGTFNFSALTADDSFIYVVNNNGRLYVVNTTSNTVATSIDPGVSGIPEAGMLIYPGTGTLDTSFGNQGFTLTPLSREDTIQDIAVQTDDKILIAGTTQKLNATCSYLARYTANGILDTSSFNTSSTPGYFILQPSSLSPAASACEANALIVDASNNILVVGYATQDTTKMLLARYTSSGILDTTFPGGSGPGYTTLTVGEGFTPSVIGLQSGKIIVGGTSVQNGVPVFTLARFNSDGTIDTAFGGNGTGYRTDIFGNISILKAMRIPLSTSDYWPDSIFVAGDVDNQIYVARYNANGTLAASNFVSTIVKATLPPGSLSTNLVYLNLKKSSAYDLSYTDSTVNTVGTLYVAGSGVVDGATQGLIVALSGDLSFADYRFNNDASLSADPQPTDTGYILQSVTNGSEFYSLLPKMHISDDSTDAPLVAGGYAIGDLANQINLAGYWPIRLSFGNATLGVWWGCPNFYFNSNAGATLTTIGTLTSARKLAYQSDSKVVTAGTGDGTYYVARYYNNPG